MSVLRVADARRRAVKVRPSSRTVLADARDAADLLKALAHEARLVILCLLVEGEKAVTKLGELIGRRQARGWLAGRQKRRVQFAARSCK